MKLRRSAHNVSIVSKPSLKSHTYIMSIRKILSPLLIMSYVCGSRVVEFSTDVPRQWFGFLYMLLVWSLYNFVFIYVAVPQMIYYSTLYHIWCAINMFIALLSIIVGIYHDKTFRNCIKNITAVDNTLEKLGIKTDYTLHIRTIWLILGWFVIAIIIACLDTLNLKNQNFNIAESILIPFLRMYCTNINIINDLTVTNMLWYVGLKFDQINEYLENLTINNKRRMKRAWEDSVLLFHQSRYTKAPRNAYMIWIVIHLHLELRKMSHKIDLIFGTQMTIEMGCCFVYIALGFQDIFNMIFDIKDFRDKKHLLIVVPLWLFLHIFRLFLINYACERVRIKANATGNLISKWSYSSCDDEIRENILQFLLMIQSPIRFYGLGLFQFGFKCLQSIATSIVTILIIFLQNYTNDYIHFLKKLYNVQK